MIKRHPYGKKWWLCETRIFFGIFGPQLTGPVDFSPITGKKETEGETGTWRTRLLSLSDRFSIEKDGERVMGRRGFAGIVFGVD